MSVLQALNWHYGVKRFSDQLVEPARLEMLLEATRLSPSAYGLQPYRLWVITDKAVRARLLPYSYGQQKVLDSSHLVVFAARQDIDSEFIAHHTQYLAKQRQLDNATQQSMQQYYQEKLVDTVTATERLQWAYQQTYLALGNFLTSAALLEIDACPMTGIEFGQYDELLGLNERGFTTVAICVLGNRDPEDSYAQQLKVRLPMEELVEWVA